jgi:hypothetical protein
MFTTLSFGPKQCPAGFTQTATVTYAGVTVVSAGVQNNGYNGDLVISQLYAGSPTQAFAQVKNTGRIAVEWLLWIVIYTPDETTVVSAEDAVFAVEQAPVRT